MASHVFLKGKGARSLVAGTLLVIATLLLSACGSTPTNNTGPKILTAIGFQGGSYTENYSPFSPNVVNGIIGPVYEPLEYVNGVTGQESPTLAISHQYNADNTQLTFTLRSGVQWSDGQPFTSADVKFTFDLLHSNPGADGQALWNYFDSVSAPDDHTVVITFKKVYPPLLPFIEGTTIVPQHIYQNLGDPTKGAAVTTKPVGTGPMVLKSFTPQLIVYQKNPKFWGASQVKVDELHYVAVSSADTSLLKLVAHQVDWTGFYNASLNSSFVNKDQQHNHVFMVPVDPVMLVLNLKKFPFNVLAVRQAISAALDRHEMSVSGESGLEQVAYPTGLVPGQEGFQDPQYSSLTFGAPDTSKSDQLLQGAGFTKGSDGIYADAQGRKISFKVEVPSDFTDYVADLQIAQQNLKSAGIDLQLNEVSDNAYFTDRPAGTYGDAIISGSTTFGSTPFYYYNAMLNSANVPGPHATNSTNWEGWQDAATDQLLNTYANSSDPNVQKQALFGIEKIMVDQVPVLPLLGAIQFFEYTTVKWTGWPTPDNLYAIGSAYSLGAGDNEQVLLHLTPVS